MAALGTSLGAHDSLLGSLWTSKTLKNCRFFKVFENAACLLFEALHGALGLVLPVHWADLAPKWAPKRLQNGPKMVPEMGPTKALKNDGKKAENGAQNGHQNEPKIAPKRCGFSVKSRPRSKHSSFSGFHG